MSVEAKSLTTNREEERGRIALESISYEAFSNEESLPNVYETLGPYSKKMIQLIGRGYFSGQDTSDLFHESFLKAWQRRETYEAGRGPFIAWYVSIVRNTTIDEMRRRGKRPQEVNVGNIEGLLDYAMIDLEEAPNTDIVELRVDLQDAIEKLPDIQKNYVNAVYRSGRSYREIAMSLEIPLGTFKTRINKGQKLLREILGENYLSGDVFDAAVSSGEE